MKKKKNVKKTEWNERIWKCLDKVEKCELGETCNIEGHTAPHTTSKQQIILVKLCWVAWLKFKSA